MCWLSNYLPIMPEGAKNRAGFKRAVRVPKQEGGTNVIQREGDKCTVIPVGRIDTNSAAQFAEEMDQALPGTRELVLDCSQLEYISSSGLKVVLKGIKAMYEQGEMRIINVSDAIYEVLKITGFLGVCDVETRA